MTAPRPSCREDFEIAIICALPLEYDMVALLFDEFWDKDGDTFGRAVGDPNTYTTGRIGRHNVVLALLSHMGKANAAAAAASMRSSYGALRLVLLAGICGGMPRHGQDEILLGDIIIGKTVVQYDFGRRYPNEFMRKDTAEDDLRKNDKNIRNFLALFETDNGRGMLRERTAQYLRQLQSKDGKHQIKYRYPGTAADKLFESSYRHMHRVLPTCVCIDCHGRMDPVCDEALSSSCDDLGCDERYLEPRERLQARQQLEQELKDETQDPAIHIGTIASGDTVMKSGEDRDRIAKKEGVIGFEMEGAGVWEEVPCIVVKGVCDYADCHKNKKWQDFAAATAASASKAILQQYVQTDKRRGKISEEPRRGHFLVSFGRNQSFVGRKTTLSKLLERIWPGINKDDCQRTAVEGLGGVGKTQIALEVVYRVRDEHPDCSVFWVPVVDATSFENAYRDIGKQMKIKGIDEDKADVKRLVKTALSDESSGSWLLVVDNADDENLLLGAARLADYLPFSRKGSILFTTRNHKVAIRLGIPKKDIIAVTKMDCGEAFDLLRKDLKESQTSEAESTRRLLTILANLPLAIRQASAFMAENQISTLEYLELCESERKDMIDLLSRDFDDPHRYKQIQNPVATTWLISFNHISQHHQLAARYLKFMSLLAEKDIPKSLLPAARKIEATEAIGTLKAYAFIGQREGQDSFDMHRLVRLAIQKWLEDKGELKGWITSALRRLDEVFPFPEHENRDMWMKYLPHVKATLELREHSPDKKVEAPPFDKVAMSHSVQRTPRLCGKVPGKGHEGSTDKKVEASLIANIAASHYVLGQYQTAEKMHRQALKLRTTALGKDHPDTLKSMNNLANVLQSLGNYEEAEQIYQQTLELMKRSLGKDHPVTLGSMNNLANVFNRLGKYEEAEQMHRQALKLRTTALGKDHPDTLKSMNNLANVLQSLGNYEEAEQIYRQTLELIKRVLGKDHPVTLTSIDNLSGVLAILGKYEEAEQMHRQILERRETLLGKKHPDTLNSMDNLAVVLRSLGKYGEAEQMHRQILERRETLLGKTHPDTLTSMDNLAVVLRSLGKYGEAEQMHRQTLELRETVLGKKHPDTLTSMDNLASGLDSLGKYEEAEQMHRQTLELRETVLGKKHPDTLTSMDNLASGLDSLGKYEEAEQMHRQTLELRETLLGKKHPDTLGSMNNLAVVLENLGEYKEAEQIHRQTLELREQALGKDHPDTRQSKVNLEDCSRAKGRRGFAA